MIKIATEAIFKNDYAREPVPFVQRRGWIALGLIWFGVGIDLSSVFLGSALASGLSLQNAIAAILIGSFILGIIAALCSYIGARTGCSFPMITRFAFGEHGSKVIIILLSLTVFGWFGVSAGFFGVSAQATIESVMGISISEKWLVLIGGLLMTLTATIGYHGLEKLSLFAVPLMTAMLGVLLYQVLTPVDPTGPSPALPLTEPLSMGIAISLVVSIFLEAAITSPDISRWAKSTRDAILCGFFGFFIGNAIMISVAVILAKFAGTEDVIQVMLTLGWGFLAVTLLILAQWTTNDNNLYSLSLGLSILFKKTPKYILTIVGGLLGTGLAVWGIYENFISFLILLAPLSGPIGGIYLVEYFFLNKQRFQFVFIQNHQLPSVNGLAFAVWGLASGIAYATTPAPEGFGLFYFTTIPALDGFVAAVILHFALGKAFSTKASKPEIVEEVSEKAIHNKTTT